VDEYYHENALNQQVLQLIRERKYGTEKKRRRNAYM